MQKNLHRLFTSVAVLLIVSFGVHTFMSSGASSAKGEYIQLNDISMYIEQYGKGEPIIFLHGGMGSAESWQNQISIFSKKYRVITPDSRGQGRTTDSAAPLSYHLMAEDIIHLMDKLKIPSVYVVGWSDGGNIAIDLAIHHADRVKKIVAYGANINPAGLQPHFLNYLRTATPEQMARDNGSDYLALSKTPDHLPVMAQKIRNLWLTEPTFSPAELAKISAPSLIMDGEDEELIRPDHAQEIAKAIPHSILIRLPDVGHYALFKTPKQWNDAVLNFLK